MATAWVDFKAVKAAVTVEMVLDHYGVTGLQRAGGELRGPCPIHRSAKTSRHLSVNLSKGAFKCFASSCGARGNVLDFVAAMENCTVRDAALKLGEWFKVGDSSASKNQNSNHSATLKAIASLESLVDEIEAHNSQIASNASMVETKTAAVKELVATLLKEVR